MAEQAAGERQDSGDRDDWLMLTDPHWRPTMVNEAPPFESVLGMWPVGEGGAIGPFRANTGYVPSDPNSPTDPLDALFRVVATGKGDLDRLRSTLRDTLVDVAIGEDRQPIRRRSPDEVECLVVVTSAPHAARVDAADWLRIDAAGLVALLRAGVDALFNPDSPASVRLTAEFIGECVSYVDTWTPAEEMRNEPVQLIPWDASVGPVAPEGQGAGNA